MRFLAAFFNISLLLFVVYLLVTKGVPKGEEVLLLVLLFAAPIASLFAMFSGRARDGDGLFSLYLQRKRLEELQRIERLRSKNGA